MKKYLCMLSFCFLQSAIPSFAQNKHISTSDSIGLSEVIVIAERPFVQRKADRMIVSVEHSKLLKSRSLSNILNLIPGVNYDGDGGITIMGNGIRIYENGKLVRLSGTQLKRYLSSLRGNDIKNLELLPQATAEYDAEGGTGVLVINRQKKHEYGLAGYVGSEYEQKRKNLFSEFAGLTYSWGNIALYANMALGQSKSLSKMSESDYGRNITVNSISESTDKSLYYMDLYEYENKYTKGIGGDSIITKSQPSFERINIYSVQVDFTKIFSRHQFTLGAKYVNAGIDYDNKLYLGNTTLGGTLSEDADERDDFSYDERRYAIYGMYRYYARPWDFQVGLRDEYTECNTQQIVKNQLHNSKRDNKFFPSFFVRKDMGQGNSLSLSYTQSINRPSYQMVNPFVFHLSETSYKEGNPNLKGELLYNAALQFVFKSRYVFSLSALFIDKKINEVYEQIDEQQTRYTLRNDGNFKKFALYMEIPFKCGIWNNRSNVEISGNFYRNSAKRVNDLGLVISSFNRFRLSNKLTAMTNLRYIRHYKQLYLIQKSDYFGVDIEGDYSCLKDKLNINFGVKDLLNSRGKNQQIFKNGEFEHHTDFHFISRKFFVSATFSFSAGSKRASLHGKIHSNEEEKERM